MKFYYILLTVIAINIFGIGILSAKLSHNTSSENFKNYGQYDPSIILLDNEQMLLKCEEHDLTYNFEEGICI